MALSGFQLHHMLCSCCFVVAALWGLEHGHFGGVWRGNQGGSLRGVTAKEMFPPGKAHLKGKVLGAMEVNALIFFQEGSQEPEGSVL